MALVLRESATRSTDLPARLGGDEFAMILPETDIVGALQIGEKLAAAVDAMNFPHAPDASHSRVTLSVGVASIIPSPDNTQEAIFRIADRGTYRSKRAGRNQASLGH